MTIITGASSGIGRSLARRLAADGEPVVLVARRQPLLDSLVEEIERAGRRAMAIACDVTDRAAVLETAQRAEARFGSTTRPVAGSRPGQTTRRGQAADRNEMPGPPREHSWQDRVDALGDTDEVGRPPRRPRRR
jgi:NAD(P)-dependent dehydrogenase (short-subunit alcohol dehydrogenase family)